MKFGRWLFVVIVLLSLPRVVAAQTAETYQLLYYAVGASSPLQATDTFPASAIACNQAPPTTLNTINPTRVIWDDTVNPGRVCSYSPPPTGSLPSLPLGNFEGSLVAGNAVGTVESARSPFSRQGPPLVPSGVRFGR